MNSSMGTSTMNNDDDDDDDVTFVLPSVDPYAFPEFLLRLFAVPFSVL